MVRIIPAWAGNTTSPQAFIETVSGSSPRGRGTQRARLRRPTSLIRIIPAWAGNTCASSKVRSLGLRIIPAWAGNTLDPASYTGSSPRGRGTPVSSFPAIGSIAPWTRIIPAWAGNTPDPPEPLPSWPDHPRVGGEHPGIVP